MKKSVSLFLLAASVAVCAQAESVQSDVESAPVETEEAEVWGPVVEEPAVAANTEQPIAAVETPEGVEPILE